MKIVIAEDEPMSRFLLENALQEMGHEVVAVADGREAWELFQREPFPILIADWMMPQIDGPQLCRMIRAENSPNYTYIILLTALGGKGSFLTGLQAGADDFVTKPFDRDQLQARLEVAARILRLNSKVKQLEGLLPICSYCKKIRDDEEHWVEVERYLAQRTKASFTHGICPHCLTHQLEQFQLAESQAAPCV